MNWKIFFQRNIDFKTKLVRLHGLNGIFFFILMITGLLLISSTFYTAFPAVRYQLKNVHIVIGLLSILPILFYLPKIKTHLKLKQGKGNGNLYFVLGMLGMLMISGLILTFQKHLPPMASSVALTIHEITFWISIPYIAYHGITRSRWFKSIEEGRREKEGLQQEGAVTEESPAIYNRRKFLRFLTGTLVVIGFFPMIVKGLKPFLDKVAKVTIAVEEQVFAKLPDSTFAKPDGEGMQGSFRYYTITENPQLTPENWSLTIDGLVNKKRTYNWDQFMGLKRDVQVSDFHCITGWSVYNVTYEGIPLKEFLQEAGVKQEAKYVKFYSADGVYTDCLTLDQALLDDMMVAVSVDGELITHNNGGPVRLITPQMYAYKSVKWLKRIELIEDEHIGYWVQYGYDQHAWVK